MREFDQATPGHDSASNGARSFQSGNEHAPARPPIVSPYRVGSEPRSAPRIVSPRAYDERLQTAPAVESETVPSPNEGQAKDPKETPVTMVLSGHENRNADTLGVFKTEIEKRLEEFPTGKIAVVVEAANGTTSFSDKVRERVAQGAKPSEALRKSKWRNIRVPSYAPRYDQYQRTADTVLDELAEAHPGRLDVIPEGHPRKIARKITPRGRKVFFFDYRPKKEGWKDALRATEEREKRGAPRLAERDDGIADQIKTITADPEIVAVVGLMGAYHTGITHNLIKEGYPVTRVFPDKENGVFIYNPQTSYQRTVRFRPDNVPPLEDLDMVVATEVDLWRRHDESEQAFTRRKYQWIRDRKKVITNGYKIYPTSDQGQ